MNMRCMWLYLSGCGLPLITLCCFQSAGVNHSHPVVVEWGKTYDSIIKFKESLIAVLSEHQHRIPQLASSVEELRIVELHSLDQ